MKKLSDWEMLLQQFKEDFPELASMKTCGNCVYSTWAKVNTKSDEEVFTPYCSQLKMVLRELTEAETCSTYTERT